MCVSLMCGRIGCIAGALASAYLLDNHCEWIFYISGSMLLGGYMLLVKMILHFQLK